METYTVLLFAFILCLLLGISWTKERGKTCIQHHGFREGPQIEQLAVGSIDMAIMRADDAPSAPTPPQEDQPNTAYASYVPHDLKYNADFEDAVMRIALASPAAQEGLRIIPVDSSEQPVEGVSVRAQDISLQSLPVIAEADLPLPLDDPRRIFASPVPGIKLTHPGGYLEGGPGLDPDMDTFPEDFLNNHSHLHTIAELRAAVDKQIEEKTSELMERMRKREQATKDNEEVEKKLQELVLQHAMELKVHKKLADDRRAKKEAREKRRAEREAG